MATKIRNHKLFFKLSRGIGLRLAVILTFGLLSVSGNPLKAVEGRQPAESMDHELAAPAQKRDRRAAQKKFEEGEELRNQGTAESLRQALKKYEEALQIWRDADDPNGVAKTLNSVGFVYNSLGDLRKALDYYSQALQANRTAGNRNGEAVTLGNIGSVLDLLGEKQKAVDFYSQALQLDRAAGNRGLEALTLSNIAGLYASLGENQKALDYHSQALSIRRAAGDRKGEAFSLTNIGSTYYSLGEYQKALDFYNQALQLNRQIGDRRLEATTLSNVGVAYHFLGEKQKALDFHSQALSLYRAIGDRRGEAFTLSNIGLVYDSAGEKQKALDLYNQALPIHRATGVRLGEIFTLNNIGGVYYSLGEKQKAVDFYTQALEIQRIIGERRGEAITLNNIGVVYKLMGENQRAIDFYIQALELHRAVGDRMGESKTLGNIGLAYDELGEKRKALDFYNQALSIGRAVGNRSGEAVTLANIGGLYGEIGEKQKALNLFNQALSISREIGESRVEARILYDTARINRALGRLDESRSQVESSLKIIESIRASVVSKDLRASYFATEQDVYEFYIDLLMQMRGRAPAGGHDAEALQVSERSRARSLLESLAEARADIRRGADPKLVERERSLQQRLNAKAEEKLKLSAGAADAERLTAIRREVDTLTAELQQLQTLIRQTNPRYAALTQPQPLTLAEIQRQALDAETLLLEYSLGKDRSFLWAVTLTTINSYELPKRDEIEAAAKGVYELLSNPPTGAAAGNSDLKETNEQYLAVAASLSRMLLGPVAAQLGKKRLLIVADGMLHYIPFGALPAPETSGQGDIRRARQGGGATGKQANPRPVALSPRLSVAHTPMIVDHEIVHLPSASTLAALRRELAGRKPAARLLAVLADPVFSINDERVKPAARLGASQSVQFDPLDESRVRILSQTGGGAQRELRIDRLPFTREEAERIMALAPAGSGMKALDFQASRATVTSGQLSQYRYIHFATHGLADSQRPELSTILLSLYDEQGRPQDGFLRAHEIYNLEMPAELLTLSACQTGLGKLTKGEGLVSLTRGFMYAGAARIVVSLWSVSDRATSELMVKFYRRMLAGGERPAAALRAAQVEMWRDNRWGTPFYWAAFTLQGEWRGQ